MVEQRLGEQYGPLIEKIMLLNPVAQIIQDIRHNLIAPDTTPTIWNLCHQWWIQLIPIAIVLLCVVLGLHVFKKHDWQFAEVL